ncbi:hypothetical protein MMC13_005449 [Lambiella insularis]|nr:hypothetical protein [Lambiella insularis]
MLLLRVAFVVLSFAFSNAAPAPSAPSWHEGRDAPAADWVKGARVEGSAILPMRIGLVQTSLERGYDFLLEVSDPTSEKYGKYWSMEEVHDMFAPLEETVKAVREWLVSSGIHDSRVIHSDNKGWLAFDATVEEAENLLQTEFHEHQHMHSASVRVGCDKQAAPSRYAALITNST